MKIASPPVDAWGLVGDISPLPGGHRNQVFRVGSGARAWVVKSTDRGEDQIRWLEPVLHAARASGLVVPEFLADGTGAFVVDGWTCETFIEGVAATDGDVPSLHQSIRRFHEVTDTVPQRPGFLGSADLERLSVAANVTLENVPDDVAELCFSFLAGCSSSRKTVVHGDLNPTNVIRVPDGRWGVVDWDETRRDAPLFDLAQTSKVPDAERAAALAWEVLVGWAVEPAYAARNARLLAKLRAGS